MIKLEFSIDEVNQIMAALGNMPYVQVAALVDKIKSLHKQLGVPADKKIPAKMLNKAAKAPGKLGQRARLAKTLRGF